MDIKARQLPGYDAHTTRTRRLLAEGELRHCWDILVVLRGLLMDIERVGTPTVYEMFPGEHRLLSRVAQKVCTRARKILANPDYVWDGVELEAEVRAEYMRSAPPGNTKASMPRWHTQALGAIRELAAVPKFQELAIKETRFDAFPRGVDYEVEE